MKTENTILRIYKNNDVINFERFTQKTATGVINQYRKYLKSCGGFPVTGMDRIFFEDYLTADRVAIFNSHTNQELASFTADEFMQAIA